MEQEKYLGYIKYDGELVEDGLMDARRQAKALLAYDGAIRELISKQAPDLKHIDFEIPMRVQKGSWEALVPETVAGWAQAGLGVVATAYFSKAASKMAEKDFENFGFTSIFSKALDGLKWFARISKHLGETGKQDLSNLKFKNNNELIGIPNNSGEYIYVPKPALDLYLDSNSKLLEELARNIAEGRSLKIGTYSDGVKDEVTIGKQDKAIFCKDDSEDDDEVLVLPELVHGATVVIEGEVTRENKTSNSLGFKYLGHILTAYPDVGSVVKYKPLLFLRCKLVGTVSRLDEKGRIAAKRPKLIVSHLEALEQTNGDLFD
ncbi:hypothetical protein ATN50_00070 [Vibrio parahaemolyticus]|uniref:hypothetical protein n=2 Tax=Vibrio parahaemolyticus TaxID=670 RepID=UPI0005B750FC|nr:hypothetical protein [Vibrio parahaemolyticus]EGQ7779550.1 hypothetical protein [Vibrio parahaemolyticus]EGQ8400131.1 hypothetical protein [Vibrio parahaemolyticus]EGQ9050440.1 hypothetical protein [Vibrio parahaemolyticus]EGQ9589643.1 hypothetical protein [Vibrio parahaemolyticus]EGR1003217.1 hypothetical protein [Vibrio parahaemolyticus]